MKLVINATKEYDIDGTVIIRHDFSNNTDTLRLSTVYSKDIYDEICEGLSEFKNLLIKRDNAEPVDVSEYSEVSSYSRVISESSDTINIQLNKPEA